MPIRALLPFPLAAVAIGSLLTAVRVDVEPEKERQRHELPAAITPVLSARRVPDLIAAPVARRRLVAALDELMALTRGTACLTVTAGGETVYAANETISLAPASLAKLPLAITVLDVLGEDTNFRTVVGASSAPVAGVVDGDLYLVGSGDPLLMTDDYAVHFEHQPQTRTDFETLADAVVAAGVTRVLGGIVGDASRYDDQRYVDAWPNRFIAQDQSGPLSALTVNDGWVAFPPHPGTSIPDEEPAPDPAVHSATVLRDLLAERGVTLEGGARAGTAPTDIVDVAAVESPPMREIVGQMLRESDNQTAELLVKEVGVVQRGSGSTTAGIDVVQEHMASLGLPVEGVTPVDGSGLADGNGTTCVLVQSILDHAGPTSSLAGGLPVAGSSGTLTERFADVPAGHMRAKTGTLRDVTALAGYVETLPGAQLSFTFVMNLHGGDLLGPGDVELQDELISVLLSYPDVPVLSVIGPQPPDESS